MKTSIDLSRGDLLLLIAKLRGGLTDGELTEVGRRKLLRETAFALEESDVLLFDSAKAAASEDS